MLQLQLYRFRRWVWHLQFWRLAFFAAGLGIGLAPLTNAATSTVPIQEVGVASSILAVGFFCRRIGDRIGSTYKCCNFNCTDSGGGCGIFNFGGWLFLPQDWG